MRTFTLAHVSDLHLSTRTEAAAQALCDGLVAAGVDQVVVTGDVTHRGLKTELELYRRAFAPLIEAGLVTAVPGNHDRMGDDVAGALMRGRVQAVHAGGAYIVRVDSTGTHNRVMFMSHGELLPSDLEAIDQALGRAPKGALVVLLLHHHPLPLPEEAPIERISTWLGLPYSVELECGSQLVQLLRGRCDLILHGHRHRPSARYLFARDARPLHIYNAGCSTALGKTRIFSHQAGALLGDPAWFTPQEVVRAA